MHPINRLTSLVRKEDSISVKFTGVDGGTQVIVMPAIKGVNADEADPNKREQFAALASPFVFVVPAGEDINDALGRAIDAIADARVSAVSASEAYATALNDVAARTKLAAAAKLAEDKANAKAPGKSSKGTAVAAAPVTAPTPRATGPVDDEGEGNDDGESEAAAQALSEAAKTLAAPVDPATPDLFAI